MKKKQAYETGQGIVEYALILILAVVIFIVIIALLNSWLNPQAQAELELKRFKARYETCIRDESNTEEFCLVFAKDGNK